MLRVFVEYLTPELIEEGRPLLTKNWIESGSFDPELTLDPDFPRYLQLQKLGRLRAYALRDVHQRPEDPGGELQAQATLVGYAVYIFGPSMKHRELVVAHGEALYVQEAFRTQAHLLLEAAEADLKTLGVDRVGWFVVDGSRAYNFLISQGFSRDEIVVEKKL